MRVLVTGGSGYIGRHVVALLSSAGADVHAVSRARPAPVDVVAPHTIPTWHACDLLVPGAPASLVREVRPNVLLHLAWIATPGVYWTSPENVEWQRVTIELARAFVEEGGSRFVGAGTCAEYDWSSGHCDERTTPTVPATVYGRAKLAAGEATARIVGESPATAAWGRVFFLFGDDEYKVRLAPSVALALLSGEPALCTHGEQRRDFLHVEDVARAFVALVGSDVAGPVNIGSGDPRRVKDVALGIAERIGRPDLVRLGARESNEPPVLTANVSRLFDEVGWRPSMTFEQALDRTVEYWKRASQRS